MEDNIKFHPSAFKHGVNRADILHALDNSRYEGPLEDGNDDKFIALGFDCAGNLIEIVYNYVDDDTRYVFHAMSCRSIYYPLLKFY
jgi:hypothetical protein